MSSPNVLLGSDVNGRYYLRCPGCGDNHVIPTLGDPPLWTFNGSMVKPTFWPSLLVTSGHYVGNKPMGNCWCDYAARFPGERQPHFKCYRCHSYIKDGRMEFLNDCTHHLAGQTVDLPPCPE